MKNQNHKIVNRVMLVGGCFDILHPGHLDFLKKAHGLCDYLIVLLEPDEKVKLMKGTDRPRTNLEFRILNLEKTGLVNEVIALPVLRTNEEYEKTIKKIVFRVETQHAASHAEKQRAVGIITPNHKTNFVRETRSYASLQHEIIFYFGITINDRNQIKNEKIKALGKKLEIEVIEVNELLPQFSTTKVIDQTNFS